jgi:hypothetical protein
MKAIIENGTMTMELKNFSEAGAILMPDLTKTLVKAAKTKEVTAVKEQVENLREAASPNLVLSVFAGLNAAVLSGWLWAEMNYFVEIQQAVFALGVGCFVGAFVRFFGRGNNKYFGLTAVFFALLGCFIGSTLNVISFLAISADMGYMEIIIAMNKEFIAAIMAENFAYPDLFFYFVMCMIAYKVSFKSKRDFSVLKLFQMKMAVPQKDAIFNFD